MAFFTASYTFHATVYESLYYNFSSFSWIIVVALSMFSIIVVVVTVIVLVVIVIVIVVVTD